MSTPQSRSYPDALDALHERVAPGRLVSSLAGHVLASPARLPGSRMMLGLGIASAGGEPDSAATDRFVVGLLDLHRDLLRQTLRQVITHLEARTSGGTTLLDKQLIQGELADIAMSLSEDEAMPADRRATSPQARWEAHQRFVVLGRRLLRLLGASGFLADGPGASLHLAEVTGSVYLHPAAEDD
ncbi:MAG TPA: hypothetical protein VF070_46100 [Streptosporangiaceae bacterium]